MAKLIVSALRMEVAQFDACSVRHGHASDKVGEQLNELPANAVAAPRQLEPIAYAPMFATAPSCSGCLARPLTVRCGLNNAVSAGPLNVPLIPNG